MAEKRATSIHQIAEHTGVSVTTVSRVINNDSQISRATTEKVLQAVKDLGYIPRPPSKRPGPQLSNRRAVKQYHFAVITNYDPARLNTPVYSAVLNGIESFVDITPNCRISLVKEEHKVSRTEYDGAILLGVSPEYTPVMNLPCIRIMGRICDNENYDHLTYNDSYLGEKAAEYLIGKSCRKAVVISPSSHISGREHRTLSFSARFNQLGGEVVSFSEEIMFVAGGIQQLDINEFNKLAPLLQSLSSESIGVFSTTDSYLPYLYSTIYPTAGVTPGKKLYTISVNNIREVLDIIPDPKPPSFEIHTRSIGKRAVEQLLWRINNPDEPRQEIRLIPELRPKQ